MNDKKEYIEREAVENFIKDGLNNPDKSKAFGYDAVEILGEIYVMPAADVAEVRHGHWYFACVHQEKKFYKCSNCHHAFPFNNVNYCPNCGAKMDEKGD